MQLDENLKQLMKELGAAINDALSESEDISEAIQNVRNAGYDVFLVLEATVGLNKREEAGETSVVAAEETSGTPPEFEVDPQDLRFLKSLRISVDDAA